MTLDLAAYLDRIRWTGTTTPGLDALTRLLQAHMRAIPFENLDALLGRRIRLDLGSLQQKLVRDGRGGYCFEHTTLFAAVMAALGYAPVSHLARVVIATPKAQSTRTHMFILVDLPEGRFVVDPGFGGPAAITPLPLLDAGMAQPADEPGHWMARDGADWVLRGLGNDGPTSLWISELSTDYPVDFETSNHYVATHPESLFTNNIMMSRFTEDGRVTVMNRDATLRRGGEATSWQLADRQDLRRFLAEHLGIDLPEAESLAVPAIPDWA